VANKVHLYGSDKPLQEGGMAIAICHERIPRLEKVFLWDEMEMGIDIKSYLLGNWRICRKCRDVCGGTGIEGRRVYGIKTKPEEIPE
jgi:hypothetical protein